MALLNENKSSTSSSKASGRDENELLGDFESSLISPDFIANIVDVFDDQSANQQHQTECNAFHDNLKPATIPSVPLANRRANPNYGFSYGQQLRYAPWQSPFRASARPNNMNSRPPFLPNGHVYPSYPARMRHPMGNSNYTPNSNNSSFEGQTELNNSQIAGACSYASHEADTSSANKNPEASNTSSGLEMEGKKLAIAVSESPNCSRQGSMDAEEEPMPSIPDSPCPAYLSFDEMNETDDLEDCFGRQPETETNFALLPCLDDETSENRISPPMMPSIGQTLSWEVEDGEGQPPDIPGPAKLSAAKKTSRKHPLTIKPKPSFQAGNNHLPGEASGTSASVCQPLFHEHSIPFENGTHRNSLSFNPDIIGEEPLFGESRYDSHRSHPWMPLPFTCELGRDDHESIRTQSDSGRDNENAGDLFMRRPCTSFPLPARRPFPPAISQSFSFSPVQVRQTASFSAPQATGFPRQGMTAGLGSQAHHHHQPRPHIPEEVRMQLPESKNRCHALNHPVPIKFQGDMDKAMKEPLPDFSMLVNFPSSLRQNRALPQGTRCCVMCGTIRPTCSRARNRQQKPDAKPQFADYNDDFVTIPTQNKGLCTICDISVWVVKETGAQIKWCKGCKNFRQWAFFGEKGLATKCGRCRERQRSKYAKMKDVKKKQMGQQNHHVPYAREGNLSL